MVRLVDDLPGFRIIRRCPPEHVATRGGIYKVRLHVADFKPEDIKISVANRQVKISAKSENIDEDGSKISREFCKEFTLSENIVEGTVKSLMDTGRGILTIEAKLKEPKATDTVEIPIERKIKDKASG